MKVMFTGGRDYWDFVTVADVLEDLRSQGMDFVVIGDARGLDQMVREWCEATHFPHKVYYAGWKKHGKIAGPLRNKAMVESRPNLCVAFPGGKGTADCTRQARAAGIPIEEITE